MIVNAELPELYLSKLLEPKTTGEKSYVFSLQLIL